MALIISLFCFQDAWRFGLGKVLLWEASLRHCRRSQRDLALVRLGNRFNHPLTSTPVPKLSPQTVSSGTTMTSARGQRRHRCFICACHFFSYFAKSSVLVHEGKPSNRVVSLRFALLWELSGVKIWEISAVGADQDVRSTRGKQSALG